jgi:DNA-binding NarL/FixJ family response regulator
MLEIVLVDESAATRALTRHQLEFDGEFRVVGEAGDGRAAIDVIARTHPHGVVIEPDIADMNGFELIVYLRHISRAAARLVAYSADAAVLRRAVGLGADAAVVKSGNVDELRGALLSQRQPVAVEV